MDVLDAAIARLRRMQRDGGFEVISEERTTDWYEVMLFPPASEEEIASAHALLARRLPEDFVRFWRATNGANLFINESGLHGIGIASTSLITHLQLEEAEVYGGIALQPYVVFARVNGAGDFLVFELETGRVLDGVHAEQPGEWRPIAASFSEWLSRLVAHRGAYFWIEALYHPQPVEG